MKKTFILILSIILVVCSFSACSSDTTVTYTGKNAKWYNSNGYEKIVYDFERLSYEDENSEGVTIATGFYSTELTIISNLSDIPSTIPTADLDLGSTDGAYTLLTTTASCTYLDNNNTDTISSNLLFYSSDLLPIYLARTENYESTNNDFDINVNYVSGVNTVSLNDDVKTTDIPDNVYDNDLMFYLMRSRSTLTDETTEGFTVFSPKDSYIAGEGVGIEMESLTSTTFDDDELSYVAVDSSCSFVDNVFQTPSTDDNGDYAIDRIAGGIAISDTQRGSTILCDFSVNDFYMLNQSMQNVLLAFSTYEFDPYSNSLAVTYANMYTISDYTIIK